MAEEKKYYAFDNADNKAETMTKEQILAAIMEAVNNGTIGDINAGFVSKILEMNKNGNLKLWVGTMAEFNAIETKDPDTLYLFTDDQTIGDIESEIESLKKAIGDPENESVYMHKIAISIGSGGDSDFVETGHITFDLLSKSKEAITTLGGIFDAAGKDTITTMASGYCVQSLTYTIISALKLVRSGSEVTMSARTWPLDLAQDGRSDYIHVDSIGEFKDIVGMLGSAISLTYKVTDEVYGI